MTKTLTALPARQHSYAASRPGAVVITSYDEADDYLGHLVERPAGNNTRIRRFADGSITVRLHATAVVAYHVDGSITLDSGGWRTTTTADRMNRFTPAHITVSFARVYRPALGRVRIHGVAVDYRDGLRIYPTGPR